MSLVGTRSSISPKRERPPRKLFKQTKCVYSREERAENNNVFVFTMNYQKKPITDDKIYDKTYYVRSFTERKVYYVILYPFRQMKMRRIRIGTYFIRSSPFCCLRIGMTGEGNIIFSHQYPVYWVQRIGLIILYQRPWFYMFFPAWYKINIYSSADEKYYYVLFFRPAGI